MRVKTKCLMICILFIELIMIFISLLLMSQQSAIGAFASSIPKYQLSYDYELYYHVDDGQTLMEKKDNIYEVNLQCTPTEKTAVSLYLFETSCTETIKSNSVSLISAIVELNSAFEISQMILTDEQGVHICEGANSLSISNLNEGNRYFLNATLKGAEWNIEESAAWYSVLLSTSFYIDTIKPTIIGASINPYGKYVNANFTVQGMDNVSIANVYVKEPNSEVFIKRGNSITIQRNSQEGLYTFFSKDEAGNDSEEYYVYLDKSAPLGKLTNKSGMVLDEFFTNETFCYTAYDEGSGINYFQIKNPKQTIWTNYVSGTFINNKSNGEYLFRAVDKCGNVSKIKSITLDTEKPLVKIYAGTENVSNGGVTVNEISFEPIDELSGINEYYIQMPNSSTYVPYVLGEKFNDLGTYFFYCTDKAGNISETYSVTVEALHVHNYKSETFLPDCITDGYTIYRCDCGDSYINNSIAALRHNFSDWQVNENSTCTETGSKVKVCLRCGQSKTEEIPAIGHKYVESVINSSCIQTGGIIHRCLNCNYEYMSDEKPATGHMYISEVKIVATCIDEGERFFQCENCGDSYKSVIPATGHHYNFASEEVRDGKVIRLYNCADCDEYYLEEIKNQYQEVINYVDYLFKQYESYMWWVLIASAGVWSIIIGVMFAMAHKNEDKEKAKKLFINYVIGLIVIAVIVVACPYLIRGIASIV